jgi:ABC-type Zn uptake system ZnuABC Zn-binding protein ZnuA
MNVFKELEEIENAKDLLKNTYDGLLDLYKKHPKECSLLLKELLQIEKEYEDLQKEFENIQHEIY